MKRRHFQALLDYLTCSVLKIPVGTIHISIAKCNEAVYNEVLFMIYLFPSNLVPADVRCKDTDVKVPRPCDTRWTWHSLWWWLWWLRAALSTTVGLLGGILRCRAGSSRRPNCPLTVIPTFNILEQFIGIVLSNCSCYNSLNYFPFFYSFISFV